MSERRFSLLVILCLVISACAGKFTPDTSLVSGALPANSAKLTIKRTGERLYDAGPATVEVNGKKVADIAADDSITIAIAAGPTTLAVYAPAHPGKFAVTIQADASRSYTAEVSPRAESYIPVAALGAFGAALDAALNENAGAFKLRLVSASMAS